MSIRIAFNIGFAVLSKEELPCLFEKKRRKHTNETL
jgi:hypothetical protein